MTTPPVSQQAEHDPLTCELCHAEGTGAEIEYLTAQVNQLRALLSEVAASGISFQDPRVRYLEVQIDCSTWDDIAAALRTNEREDT